jgi:hypothetical protein
MASENTSEKASFTMLLYNITDDEPNNKPETTPVRNEIVVPISKAALKAYL